MKATNDSRSPTPKELLVMDFRYGIIACPLARLTSSYDHYPPLILRFLFVKRRYPPRRREFHPGLL